MKTLFLFFGGLLFSAASMAHSASPLSCQLNGEPLEVTSGYLCGSNATWPKVENLQEQPSGRCVVAGFAKLNKKMNLEVTGDTFLPCLQTKIIVDGEDIRQALETLRMEPPVCGSPEITHAPDQNDGKAIVQINYKATVQSIKADGKLYTVTCQQR